MRMKKDAASPVLAKKALRLNRETLANVHSGIKAGVSFGCPKGAASASGASSAAAQQ